MNTAKQLLIDALRSMAADGLCYPGVGCGCMLDDLAPGGYGCLNLEHCVAAKYFGTKEGDPALIEENAGRLFRADGGAMSKDILGTGEDAASIEYAPEITYDDWQALVRELIAEVEQLRSLTLDQQYMMDDLDKEIASKDARIKELKAVISEAFRELVTAGPDIGDIATMDISLAIRKLASQNKRLRAAFLEATKEIVYATHEGRDAPEGEDVYAEKVAREALEQLQAEGKVGGGKTEYGGQHHCGTQISRTGGGEWHCPKCNPLLTAEQRRRGEAGCIEEHWRHWSRGA